MGVGQEFQGVDKKPALRLGWVWSTVTVVLLRGGYTIVRH